jgi:hypothetical protein
MLKPADMAQHLQPHVPILILDINGLPPVSPQVDVVERARKLDPQGSRHVRSLPQCDARNKT